VPEQIGDRFDVYAHLKPRHRRRVAQGVYPDTVHACLGGCHLNRPQDVAWLDRRPQFGGEHQTRVLPLVGGAELFGGLLFAACSQHRHQGCAERHGAPGAVRLGFGHHQRWRNDLQQGLAIARSVDPMFYVTVVGYIYLVGIPNGVLRADDSAMREIEDALRIAQRSADELALTAARTTLGLALVHRHTVYERDRGQKLLVEVRDMCQRNRFSLGDLPLLEVYLAREQARCGDRDDAIPRLRAAVDHALRELLAWGVLATGVLVETLLDRGAHGDVAEAEAAIEGSAAAVAVTDDSFPPVDILLLRLRALLARAHADDAAYRDYRDRYRAMARTLGFEGHIKWAEAMS